MKETAFRRSGLAVLIIAGFAAAADAQAPDAAGAPAGAPEARVELVIAEDVFDRQPVEPKRTFPAGQTHVAAWTRAIDLAGTTIEHVWRYQDLEWVVPLDVGSPSWRTWSRKTLLPEWTGEWTVEIRVAGGRTLASDRFVIAD